MREGIRQYLPIDRLFRTPRESDRKSYCCRNRLKPSLRLSSLIEGISSNGITKLYATFHSSDHTALIYRLLHGKSFLMQKQGVCKYRTKHFPCCNFLILYLWKFSPSTRFSFFIRHNKYQFMFVFRFSASTLSPLQKT